MKAKYVFLFLLLCGSTLSAQDVIEHKRGEDLQQYLLDSIKFVVPEFQSGVVIFNDGNYSRGPINISTIEQRIYFIASDGQYQVLSNEDQVTRATIKNRTFVKSKYGYVELLRNNEKASLGAVRRTSFFETEKVGAYGMASQTTSVTTIGSIQTNGTMYTLGVDQKTPFKYKIIPYLYKDGKVLMTTKKNFQKCFPAKKAEIDAYLKDNSVNFEDMDDMTALYEYLIQ